MNCIGFDSFDDSPWRDPNRLDSDRFHAVKGLEWVWLPKGIELQGTSCRIRWNGGIGRGQSSNHEGRFRESKMRAAVIYLHM